MYDHTFLNLQITRSDIRPHIKWVVSLVTVYMVTLIFLGVCVGMYGLTYFNHINHPTFERGNQCQSRLIEKIEEINGGNISGKDEFFNLLPKVA